MWREIAVTADVALNSAVSRRLNEKRVLLVRTDFGLFALDDRCPHQEQTMIGAQVNQDSIECPWHSVKIDLETGRILNDMGFRGMPDVKVYPTKEENGKIFIEC